MTLRATEGGAGLGWRVFVDGPQPAAAHMALDEQLAQDGQAAVRLFTWSPAISLGWKQVPPGWVEGARLAAGGVELVERPTGGGIAFHGSDVSLAVVMPREPASSRLNDLMQTICHSAAAVCLSAGVEPETILEASAAGRIMYCLTEPSPYAVMIKGRKVAGFALRRYPASWLIQGSLLVNPLPPAVRQLLPPAEAALLKTRAISLSEGCGRPLAEDDVARRWAASWTQWWTKASGSP